MLAHTLLHTRMCARGNHLLQPAMREEFHGFQFLLDAKTTSAYGLPRTRGPHRPVSMHGRVCVLLTTTTHVPNPVHDLAEEFELLFRASTRVSE